MTQADTRTLDALIDAGTDLRQGITPQHHRLLDLLEQIEPRAAGFTATLIAVAEKRADQINRYGYDADHDAMQPMDTLALQAKIFAHAARERIRGTHEPQNLNVARAKLITAATLAIAGVCRLTRN